MRRISFIIAILGIFILLVILVSSRPVLVSSAHQLLPLQENQKILVSGLVIKETPYYENSIITLDNKIQVQCKNCPSFLDKNITVLGVIERYTKEPTIKPLKITEK